MYNCMKNKMDPSFPTLFFSLSYAFFERSTKLTATKSRKARWSFLKLEMAAIFHTKGFSGKKVCYLFRLLQFTLFANISHKPANSHGGSTPWWSLDPIFLAYFHGKTILNTWKWLSRRLCVILNCIKFSKYDTKDFFFWSCISFCKLQRCVISHQVVFNTTIVNVLFHLYLSIKFWENKTCWMLSSMLICYV